jgi:hypothetical protein
VKRCLWGLSTQGASVGQQYVCQLGACRLSMMTNGVRGVSYGRGRLPLGQGSGAQWRGGVETAWKGNGGTATCLLSVVPSQYLKVWVIHGFLTWWFYRDSTSGA